MKRYAAILASLMVCVGVLSSTHATTKPVDAQVDTTKRISTSDVMVKPKPTRRKRVPITQHVDKWVRYIATWYSPQGGEGDGLTTYTGARVSEGTTIAVDPHVIPLGSLVEVKFPDGRVHTYKATDTGGGIHGHRLDIFAWSERECIRNGVKSVMVRVIKPITRSDRHVVHIIQWRFHTTRPVIA